MRQANEQLTLEQCMEKHFSNPSVMAVGGLIKHYIADCNGSAMHSCLLAG